MSSINEQDKSQDVQDVLETTPGKKSVVSAKRKLGTESKDVQPKEAFGTGTTTSSSTPQRGQMVDTPLSSPSPAKRKAAYGEIKEKFVSFNTQLQTSCKAALYDLSLGDTKSIGSTLQAILGQSTSFVDGTLPLLNREELYCKATIQKNNSLTAYNQHLHRENNELRIKLKQFSEFESTMLMDLAFEEDQRKNEEEGEQKKGKEKEEEKKEMKQTEEDQEITPK